MHKQLFENFISENLDQIYRFAYGYMGNQSDAEDVVNDSVIKALSALDALRSPEFMSTWFYRIIINTANTALRKRARVIPFDPHSFEHGQAEATSDLSLEDLIEPLNPEYRAVVILRYLEDKSLNEIAEILGENLNTIKTRLYRALKQLRIHIDEGGLYVNT